MESYRSLQLAQIALIDELNKRRLAHNGSVEDYRRMLGEFGTAFRALSDAMASHSEYMAIEYPSSKEQS